MADETRAVFGITGPDLEQEELTVTAAGIQVGRTANNDLTLAHAQVSRRHLRLHVDGDDVYATDLGSSNGTYLNDTRLEAQAATPLAVGDGLRLGPFVLTLREIVVPEPPPVEEPPPPEPEPEPEPPVAEEPPPPPEPEPPVAEEAPEAEPEPEPEPPPQPPRRRRRREPEPEPEPPPQQSFEVVKRDDISLEDQRSREQEYQGRLARLPKSRLDGYDAQNHLVGLPRDASTWLQYLPAIYSEDDFMGRYLLICESIMAPLFWMVDNFDMFLTPEVAPEEWLRWMSSWFDLILIPELPEENQRQIMYQIGWLFLRRGTRPGLERLLQLYFGVTPEIQEESCHFTVTIPLSASRVRVDSDVIERLIASQKPAFASFTLEIN